MNAPELKSQIREMKTLILGLNNTIAAAYDQIEEMERQLSTAEMIRQPRSPIIEVA